MSYTAPVNELRFGIRVHGRLDEILQLPHAEGLDAETVDAVLDEAARFASEQWAGTNRTGDLYGAHICVRFLHKLRDEQVFASLDALRQQIAQDIVSAKHYFSH